MCPTPYEGAEGFELVLDLLEDACDNLLDHIVEKLGVRNQKSEIRNQKLEVKELRS